jgi:phosphoenolpyruvate phosphomutase
LPADAVLIHSKKADVSEIEAFMKEWQNRLPIIIVPTKYYSTPTEQFREMGVGLVIWANHNLRAATDAMAKTAKQIFTEQSLTNIEDKITPVSEIFRLQGAEELQAAEEKYLPASGKNVHALILAASQGEDLGELTKDIPKTLLKVRGKTILGHQIDAFNQIGIKDITVVRGFAKEKISGVNIQTIDNDGFASTTELYSLYIARDKIKGNTLISYGDLIFKNYIVNDLLNDQSDITIIADMDYDANSPTYHEYVQTDIPYSKKSFFASIQLKHISSDLPKNEIQGEFIGIFKVNEKGAAVIRNTLEKMVALPNFKQLRMQHLLEEIVKVHPVAVKFIKGSWLDVNTIVDLQKAYERNTII